MPTLIIHTTDSSFESRAESVKYDHPEAAMAAGVHGALEIVQDEILAGKTSTAVEVRIERPDGSVVLRSVVAVSVSSLLTGDRQIARLVADEL